MNPRVLLLKMIEIQVKREDINEKDISTKSKKTQESTWVQEKNENIGRAQRAQKEKK
jgi:hypothetical protein